MDHPNVRILGYPSIQLFPRGDRMSPIDYEGEYTTEALLAFLAENRVPINTDSDESATGQQYDNSGDSSSSSSRIDLDTASSAIEVEVDGLGDVSSAAGGGSSDNSSRYRSKNKTKIS